MGLRGPAPSGAKAAGRSGDLPKAPAGTPAEIRRLFNLIVRGNPHLTKGDTLMILQYAEAAWLQSVALGEMLREGIWILDTTHGDGTEKRRHPNVITWRTGAEVARQAAMRLGAAPLDRMRVVQAEDDDEDLGAALFRAAAERAARG